MPQIQKISKQIVFMPSIQKISESNKTNYGNFLCQSVSLT